MTGRALALAVVLLLVAGCASAPEPLTGADACDWAKVEAWGHLERLEAARDAGAIAGHELGSARFGERTCGALSVTSLRDGDVKALAFLGDVVKKDREVAFAPFAARVDLREPAPPERLGVTRGELEVVVPGTSTSGYATTRPGVYLLVRRDGEGTPVVASVVHVTRGPLVDAVHGAVAWRAVVRRIELAVEKGARLDQLHDEVACIGAIPFEEDRAAAARPFETYLAEVRRRTQAIERAWPGAPLGARCSLAREAASVAAAIEGIDARGAQRKLASRLHDDVKQQLGAAATKAEQEGAAFTAAGWRLALATFGDPASRDHAVALARAEVAALVPALVAPPRPSVDALYAGGLVPADALAARAGVAPAGRAAHAKAAAVPPARLQLLALENGLSSRVERTEVVHRFTRRNPAWTKWKARLDELEAAQKTAEATAAANANYVKQVSEYKDVLVKVTMDSSGKYHHTYRKEKQTRTYVDSAMEARHRAALQEAEALATRVRAHAALQPPPRIPAQTTYLEERQVWEGEVRRPCTLELDGAREVIVQRAPAPAFRLRTKGSQASDLPQENVAAADGWTTREALAAESLERFDAALGHELLPRLRAAMDRRLVAAVERRCRGDVASELAWGRAFLGLPQPEAERAALLAAIGGSP